MRSTGLRGKARLLVGPHVRRAREAAGLSQAALARRIGISPSYLNQIERNQRPLTLRVLALLRDALGVDLDVVGDDADGRLVMDVQGALADTRAGVAHAAGRDDIRELVRAFPDAARALAHWHRNAVEAQRRIEEMAIGLGADLPHGAPTPVSPYEAVLDFVHDHRNHFADLDERAERLAEDEGLHGLAAEAGLAERLRRRHGVRVALVDRDAGRRRFDAATRRLEIPRRLAPRRRAFQMAVELAFLEHGDALDRLTDTPGLGDADARALARIGLANYFAGAVVLPYGRFLEEAERVGYDIAVLASTFDVGIEAVCHRLSTLQRPGRCGVPFFFVRVDRAGNISKHHSAGELQLSRVGGTCPLWAVFAAFATPGRFVTQVAQMPDGRLHLWVARTVVQPTGGYGSPDVEFALGLGCELHHAHRLVYGRGLPTADPALAVPIGPGCRLCVRAGCRQRAYPLVGRPLDIDEARSPATPYPAM